MGDSSAYHGDLCCGEPSAVAGSECVWPSATVADNVDTVSSASKEVCCRNLSALTSACICDDSHLVDPKVVGVIEAAFEPPELSSTSVLYVSTTSGSLVY